MEQTAITDRIYSLLLNSSEAHKVTSRIIEHTLDISGSEVRQTIGAMREKGIPVASDSGGYWLAKSKAELESTIRHMESRVNKQIMHIRELRGMFRPRPVVVNSQTTAQLSIFQ